MRAHGDVVHDEQVDLVEQTGRERLLDQARSPAVRSQSAACLRRRTASVSNSRSELVRGVDMAWSVPE